MPNAFQNYQDPEWEQTSPQPGMVESFDRFGWGGRGNDINPETGEEMAGTSGLARDVNRFRGMAGRPLYTSGPEIDQRLAQQSKGVALGGLGLMARRAQGTSPSVAEQAGTAQAQAGAAGLQSMGASVSGGALARAAAGRLARRQSAGVVQRQIGVNQATRAGEMADAREGLVGATGAMRQQDIGVAKDQAALDVAQRQMNDQRENYYEDLGHDTQTAQLGARLGRSANEQAANQAANQQQRAAEAQREQNQRENIATGTSAVGGAASAYIKSQQPGTSSEAETKVNVKPLDRVKSRVRGYDRSMFHRNADDPNTLQASDNPDKGQLDKAIEGSLDSRITREDPYASSPKAGPRFGTRAHAMENPGAYERGALGAPKGYSRMYKPGPDTISTRFSDDGDQAPGSADAEHGKQGEYKDDYSRLISLSPGEAKEDIKPLSSEELHANESKLADMAKKSLPAGLPVAAVPYLASKAVGYKADAQGAQEKVDEKRSRGFTRAAEETTESENKRLQQKQDNMTLPIDIAAGPIAGQAARWLMTYSPAETKEDVVDLDAYGSEGHDVGEGPGERDFDADEYDAKFSDKVKPYDDSFHRDTPADQKKVADTYFGQASRDADDIKKGYGANLGRGPSTDRISDLQAESLRQKADEMMGDFRAGKRPQLSERQDPYNEAPDLSGAARAQEHRAKGGDNDAPMDGALRALKPFEYEYKDGFREAEGQEPGEKNVGPMADLMDEDKVARTALTRDPRTGLRAIDLKKGVKLALAGLGHLQRKLDSRRTA